MLFLSPAVALLGPASPAEQCPQLEQERTQGRRAQSLYCAASGQAAEQNGAMRFAYCALRLVRAGLQESINENMRESYA
jgi:hypothetical protein